MMKSEFRYKRNYGCNRGIKEKIKEQKESPNLKVRECDDDLDMINDGK